MMLPKTFNSTDKDEKQQDLLLPVHLTVKKITNPTFKSTENQISTAKYSFYSFIPLFLWQQCKKVTNLVSLTVSLISLSGRLSTTFKGGPFIPLASLLIMGMFKELYEDRKRKAYDRETNNRHVLILGKEKVFSCRWEEVFVGNVVRVNREDSIPADMILLVSSEADGKCFLNTGELDGEENLKTKFAIPYTQKQFHSNENGLFDFEAQCLVEAPNADLYSFSGKIIIPSVGGFLVVEEVHKENLLLKGTILQNIDHIYGLVVYAGGNCKVHRNLRSVPLKTSPSQSLVNGEVCKLIFVLFLMVLIHTIAYYHYRKKPHPMYQKESFKGDFSLAVWEIFLKALLQYHPIVPISLTITLEFIKFFQSAFIEWDKEMFIAAGTSSSSNSNIETDLAFKRPKVVCSDLMDCLGQISLICTDKTGTLTNNTMVFKKCIINRELSIFRFTSDFIHVANGYSTNEQTKHFIRTILLCNSVYPEPKQLKDCINYASTSSEEQCMIEYLYKCNVKLLQRTPEKVSFQIENAPIEHFKVLYTIEFMSERKKMTVIVQEVATGQIWVYSKGADCSILPCCTQSESELLELIRQNVEDFSNQGLRTLCFAYKQICPDIFTQWKAKMEIEGTNQNNFASFSQMEAESFAIGAVGMEDGLQEAVPQTVQNLTLAGIKFWMLTGDKREIAIDVARLAGIIHQNTKIIDFQPADDNETCILLVNSLNAPKEPKVCLLIEGSKFEEIRRNNPQLMNSFIEYALQCKSLILYRATPLHKSELVLAVKEFRSDLNILAIGDGANDVGMLREAHVGIGLVGKEGSQASKSADFSIHTFSHLQKLLLVHGSWAYHRFSKVILFIFYKSTVVYFTQFLYAFDSGFSGTGIFNPPDIIFFNIFYSAAPPLVLGIVEQFLPQNLLLLNPQLYKLGLSRRFFSRWSFWGAFLNGVYHSIFTYYSLRYILRHDLLLGNFSFGGRMYFGGVLFFIQLITVCLKAAFSISTWNFFTCIGIFGNIAFYCIVGPILGIALTKDLFKQMFCTEIFYLTIVAIPMMALLKDVLWKYLKKEYIPTSYHIALKDNSNKLVVE